MVFMNKREILMGFDAFLSNMNLLNYPYKLSFAITYMCNGRCKICGIWKKYKENPSKIKEELSLEEIEKIFENYPFFSWVSLTGGESLLRKDVIDMVRVMKENSKNFYLLNIPTNGLLVKKTVKKIDEISDIVPRTIITVSVDGHEKVHNKLRGTGSWKKTLTTYKRLRRLSREKEGLEVYIGYTLSPFNIGSVDMFLKEMRAIGISGSDIHLNLFHKSFYYDNLGLEYNQEEFKKQALNKIKDIAKTKPFRASIVSYLEKRYIELLMSYIKSGRTPLPCKAIQTSCFIDPYGDVYPCISFNKKLGSLRKADYDLKKIIARAQPLRRQIEKLDCPNCWTPCEAYQIILGNFLRQLL